MNHLSNARLAFHGFIVVLLAIYLVWAQVSISQFIMSMSVFVMVDLIYLSSVVITNMKPSPSKFALKDRNVVITGGSSGIGFSIAKLLVLEGCSNIVLIARNKQKLMDCVDEISKNKMESQSISFISLDLSTNPENIDNAISKLVQSIKSIDVLINCAGFSIPGEFQKLSTDDFQSMINVNYLSSVYITHSVIPLMVKEQFGHVIFLSSMGGQIGIPGFTAYSPSKYAIRGFAEVLQAEMRPYGVGVSLVFPPDTKTPGFDNENEKKPKITQLICEQGGIWESNDVAKVVIEAVKNRKFQVGFGSDGYFLNALTRGGSPPSSTFEFWAHCILMPFVSIYMLFLQNHFMNIINKEHKRKLE